MRLIIYSFIFLLTVVKCYSQNDIFTIKGKVNYTNLKLISVYIDTTLYKQDILEKDITINGMGDIIFNIRIQKPTKLVVAYGNKKRIEGFAVPNDTLTIEFNSDETFEVSGRLACYVQYKELVQKEMAKELNFMYKKYSKAGMNSDIFFAEQDSIDSKTIQRLYTYFEKINPPQKETFLFREENQIIYNSLFFKVINGDIKKLDFYQKKYNLIGKLTYGFSDKIDFENVNPLLISLGGYQSFLKSFVIKRIKLKYPNEREDNNFSVYIKEGVNVINEISSKPEANFLLKTLFLNMVVLDYRLMNKRDETNIVYEELSKLISGNSPYQSQAILVKNAFDDLVLDDKLSRGKNAPMFILNDIKDRIVTISNFKGKKVCIDIWATWCGNCIQRMPEWNKLVDDFKDNRNIVFLSVNADESREKWINFLNKKNIHGISLFVGDGGMKSQFTKKFNVELLPTILIIDENGKMVSAFAPEPNTLQIRELLK
jgi:thiol-disulfide isomerase/thioredoxin